MTKHECIKELGGWEGYRVGTVGLGPEVDPKEPREVWIELVPENRTGMCSACGTVCSKVHDVQERWVRDSGVFDRPCKLLVPRRRMWCPQCQKPKLERLNWLEPWARYTIRFCEEVARLCHGATHQYVAKWFHIDRKTVKDIDKRHMEHELEPVDLSDVRMLAMDEFAIHKGQQYATVIVEPNRKQVLWVGRGHGRQDIRPFFEQLGPDGCARIEAVAMDMNGAFATEVKAQCPNAAIVYDLFHVAAKYGNEVVDRVRVDEVKRLQDVPEARDVIKGTRWLLLRNKKNIRKKEDRIRLKELLDANRRLATVYILKDDLKHLWDYVSSAAARRFWKQWRSRALRSRIEPLKTFVRKLDPYIDSIISHCKYPLHTSLLEGINNKIKVIKRMAYGYRDDEFFFLKIRHSFPGIRT